ncbi:hypothetical protein B0J11DRAFT_75117 [Dendryphion nanum]|uniref:Uncharacterized protein n=1 Tax=Dendryphion nanum TaxID=256645 RepID=A0A9P9DGI0_9PLEO|nr:hypothetical protein B0J11DRAFT_75117 [Dendryphion nanum]
MVPSRRASSLFFFFSHSLLLSSRHPLTCPLTFIHPFTHSFPFLSSFIPSFLHSFIPIMLRLSAPLPRPRVRLASIRPMFFARICRHCALQRPGPLSCSFACLFQIAGSKALACSGASASTLTTLSIPVRHATHTTHAPTPLRRRCFCPLQSGPDASDALTITMLLLLLPLPFHPLVPGLLSLSIAPCSSKPTSRATMAVNHSLPPTTNNGTPILPRLLFALAVQLIRIAIPLCNSLCHCSIGPLAPLPRL